MSIVDDFSQNFRQYYGAKWYKMEESRGKYFKYSIVWDNEKVFYQPVTNLLGEVEKMIVETTWNYDFREQDKIQTEDGNMWIIDKVSSSVTEINEQAMDFFKSSTDKTIRLDLTKLCKE